MQLIEKNLSFLLYENVLSEKQNSELFTLTLNKSGVFETTNAKANSLFFRNWRKSRVIYQHDFEEFYKIMHGIILEKLKEVSETLVIDTFEMGDPEMQLTAHNHGDYYKWHTDNSSKTTANRLISFVYYFHLIPKSFDGGELILYGPGMNSYSVEPNNNRLVFFSSAIKHEVKRVICPGMLFENGRFTLNGWISKKG
jgi:Rps23 Pro-64 3,4-dihydroxylase Tpa1-like proline 4-hydroxylase